MKSPKFRYKLIQIQSQAKQFSVSQKLEEKKLKKKNLTR